MILLTAVVLGLCAGMARAQVLKIPYRSLDLKVIWLALLAFIPQLLAFTLPATRSKLPDTWAPFLLVGLQIALLAFAWVNRKQPGFWLLGAGLLLNFAVIVLNGGLMPISPTTVERLIPGMSDQWQIGARLGTGKDIVLLDSATRLWFLSDRFIFPGWPKIRVAFSLGDVLIAAGAFWMLWSLGGQQNTEQDKKGVQ